MNRSSTQGSAKKTVSAVLHVAPQGSDGAEGSEAFPLRTVSAAARLAHPGCTIHIHAGIYRERVDPPRGGTGPEQRITYMAAGDGPVEIRGSEIVTGWQRVEGDLWSVRLTREFFGGYNPYEKPLRGHWFMDKGRVHHAGAVFAGADWLVEAASQGEFSTPSPSGPRWFSRWEPEATTFWAEFPGRDPNDGRVEITVRQTVFYPSRPGCDYITVRGLVLARAATPWSPPTTEQIGLIGTNWSKGWVIEDNVIRHSCCAGITLGKYHDPEDHPERDVVEGTGGEDTYHGTIRRALAHGWSLETVGGHVVRNNTVSHCEMAGICGSLGAVRSRIEGNTIHDIHVRRLFGGFEQAGIKFHAPIDAVIARNHIFRCVLGIWLDWMSQGTRVTGNLLHDNGRPDSGSDPMPPEGDLFTEVNHGPFLVDHNLFLSERSLVSWSEGGAYVRNFFRGRIQARAERGRVTPYHRPHSTEVLGMASIGLGDNRFLGNILAHVDGLKTYGAEATRMEVRGNLYLGAARCSVHDEDARRDEDFPVETLQIQEKGGCVTCDAARPWKGITPAPLSSEPLSAPALSVAAYEMAPGVPWDLSVAYEGVRHGDGSSGPFASIPVFPCALWPIPGGGEPSSKPYSHEKHPSTFG